jgi:hypothetical protein
MWIHKFSHILSLGTSDFVRNEDMEPFLYPLDSTLNGPQFGFKLSLHLICLENIVLKRHEMIVFLLFSVDTIVCLDSLQFIYYTLRVQALWVIPNPQIRLLFLSAMVSLYLLTAQFRPSRVFIFM